MIETALSSVYFIVAVVLLGIAVYLIAAASLYLSIWLFWCQRGKDVLFVYSESPVWQAYLEAQVLPKIAERAVVMNWSERKKWRISLARFAFSYFGTWREFNPLAIVFRPWRRAQVFRFWQPFRDYKHGHDESLKKLESEFFHALEE